MVRVLRIAALALVVLLAVVVGGVVGYSTADGGLNRYYARGFGGAAIGLVVGLVVMLGLSGTWKRR